jgi:pyruvate dehydrogenase E1 component
MYPNEQDRTALDDLQTLNAIERKVRWLSAWTIHNANHIRPSIDGLKVGGHQASCTSISTIMTALYMKVLQPGDRVAVKPHAAPVLHAIEYLFGNQSREKLEQFRSFGGAQSYPSRTKDGAMVDFSTGSVGLGAAMTNFAALTQSYLRCKNLLPKGENPGRMVALVGDAELDEGNVYEALLDTWKHDVRNLWWVIDYNRQSLDGTVNEKLFRIIGRFFRAVGWNVITLKYGRSLFEAFKRPGGNALKRWFNRCPNDLYCVLTYKGGAAWRAKIKADMSEDVDLHALLDSFDDAGLHALMTDLGGHCMEAVLDAFAQVQNDKPTLFLCYTVKGHGLALQGHKDNHAGLMTPKQMAQLQADMGVRSGHEWEPDEALGVAAERVDEALRNAPFNLRPQLRAKQAAHIAIPEALPFERAEKSSTQESFGRILNAIATAGGPLADRIVTTSPDVTVSTNLGGWVNQRGLFHRKEKADTFRANQVPSIQKWGRSPSGQHIELGIAENNLFINLAALGLSHRLFGQRLFPIGTVYDPFIARGLDALNYACYQDARFMLVATPSGISLGPEGGAHQSVSSPLIGLGQAGLTTFEPAYADELAQIMRWGFTHMQDEDHGGSVYLRLSTRALPQPMRQLDGASIEAILKGGYWRHKPEGKIEQVIVYTGVMAEEAKVAYEALHETCPGLGVLAITSADRLYHDWHNGGAGSRSVPSHIEALLGDLSPMARLITLHDGHPAALSWLGSVYGHPLRALGVSGFGQCGDLDQLYHHYQIDAPALIQAVQQSLQGAQ